MGIKNVDDVSRIRTFTYLGMGSVWFENINFACAAQTIVPQLKKILNTKDFNSTSFLDFDLVLRYYEKIYCYFF